MLDLPRFGQNPFHDDDISIDEKVDYTVEHLGRMTADPAGGLLNAEIAATATALQGFDTTISSETTKLGIQKARTAAKADFRTALPNEISKLHGAVAAKFGQNSPTMLEYFPEGREVFSRCNDSLLDNKLTALYEAIQAQETAQPGFFSPETVTLAQDLVSNWAAIFGAASTGRAQYSDQADARRAAGLALSAQLYKNLLKIATIYAGQLHTDGQPLGTVRIAFYCPQHFLEDHPAQPPEAPPEPPAPPTPPAPPVPPV